MFRTSVLNLYRRVLRQRCRRWPPEELRKSAVVFSPHFDDETLGCGGTVIQKARAGASTSLVFMTDGSSSHRDQMPAEQLAHLRAAEGLAAARVLGLDESDVYLLGFAEQRLRDYEAAATDRVVHILREREPEEVYVPFEHEPVLWSEDHRATTRLVKAAIKRWGGSVIVYEYPIWYYRHWPWTGWGGSTWERKVFLKLGLSSPLGLGVIWRLPCCRDVGDVLDRKREALAQHRSQMERLSSDGVWPTLADVAGGGFLDCLVRDYELFRRYDIRVTAS